MSDAPPISEVTEDQLRAAYAPADHDRLRAMLLEYGAKPTQRAVERLRFDILHLGAGDPDRVRRLVTLALRDPRDVMTQEYFRQDGKNIPHEWAKRHPVNQKPFDAEAFRAERKRKREATRTESPARRSES